jgi:hypothetical protein
MLAIVKECIDRLGTLETNALSSGKVATLEVSGKELTMKITLREETIGKKCSGFFEGQPRVKIEAVASSDNDGSLTESIDEFKYCILIRAARGGG